jgi:hypothetical protein
MPDNPRNEAEFLDRESRLAREALLRLRGEMLDSLGRTADVAAWTARYPWPSLATAAAAGIGAGWALGSTFGRKSSSDKTAPASDQQTTESAATDESGAPHAPQTPPAASRLVSGLGTLTGALASAAFTAATEALTDVVKETMHDALHPDAPPPADAASETSSDA